MGGPEWKEATVLYAPTHVLQQNHQLQFRHKIKEVNKNLIIESRNSRVFSSLVIMG